MKRLAVILAVWALAALAGSVPAAAQDRPATMAEVVVTATRTETALDKVGGSAVSVVTAADIEAAKQTRVAEALKGIPGIDIVASGGPGSSTTVFIRGGDSKNTLVLVDGIMFNDPSSPNRSADLANLTLDNIERIEVVRGPLSALYGSNATAGVINIITKKGSGQPTAHVGAEYGSYDTWKVFGDASGQLRKVQFFAGGRQNRNRRLFGGQRPQLGYPAGRQHSRGRRLGQYHLVGKIRPRHHRRL